jgi:Tfp pilus assembly pilus retraction ATPase PilT
MEAVKLQNDYYIEVPHLDHLGFRKILIALYQYDGSDVYIKSGYPISFKKNNIKAYVTNRAIREDELGNLINEIRNAGDYDKIKAGNPIDFSYRIKDRDGIDEDLMQMVFRVHIGSFNGNAGIVMSIRAVNSKPPTVEEVALEKEIVNAHLSSMKGISFVCGVTGSGKSTTQAALNVEVLRETDNHLLTYEDPIEVSYDFLKGARTDCTQYLVGQDVPSYAAGAIACLRENPDYILLGEARDAETMGAALTLAETGHSVSTTIHVPRGFLLFSRVVSMFEPKVQGYIKTRLADMLNYIIYQDLVVDTNGKRMALREFVVLDKSSRAKLLQAKHSEVSQVLYDIFIQDGQLINDDIERHYKSGRLSQETYSRLMAQYEVSQDELIEVNT